MVTKRGDDFYTMIQIFVCGQTLYLFVILFEDVDKTSNF